MNLEALAKEEIISTLQEALGSDSWQISIVLTSGDILIGDFFPQWIKESKENISKLWIPERHKKQPNGYRFGLIFDRAINIVFNSPKGTVHGDANTIEIPFEKIANIKKLNWVSSEIKERGLKNISNPMASIVNKQNRQVADRNSLRVGSYIEAALASENVSNEGIFFEEDEMIYIDTDFFNNSQLGSVSLGAISLGGSTGAIQLAKMKLSDSVIQKTLRALSGQFMEPVNLPGFLYLPKSEITTELEGVDCFAVLCKTDDGLLPVFIKKKSLCYPLEYMGFIKSKLVFYGEIKQIPLMVEKINYTKVMFARAIGFMK